MSDTSNEALGRHPVTEKPLMKRRQELPDEAFVSADEAVEKIERGNRSVLALSHGWQVLLAGVGCGGLV